MKKILKNTLIPHEDNDFKPHILSHVGSAVVVVFAFAIFVFGFLGQTLLFSDRMLATIYPNLVASLSNQNREEAKLKALSYNPLLEEAARLKAEDMMIRGYFAHTSPEGHDPWYWIQKAGYEYEYAGENLAINFSDSADVTRAWMASPGHRANILSPQFSEIGVATVKGFVNGRETVFVVEMFGTPKVISKDVVATETTATTTPTTPQVAVSTSSAIVLNENSTSTASTTAVLGVSTINKNPIEIKEHVFTALSFMVSNTRVIVMSLYLVLALLVLLSVTLVLIFFKHHHTGRVLNAIVVLVWIMMCGLVYSYYFGGGVILG